MNSALNWRRSRSLIWVFLIADMSKLFTRGARIPLKAEESVWMLEASCWLETRLNALTLNHWPEGEEVAIRLGSLDGEPGIRPQFHTFVASRAPWDEIPDDGLPRYDEGHP